MKPLVVSIVLTFSKYDLAVRAVESLTEQSHQNHIVILISNSQDDDFNGSLRDTLGDQVQFVCSGANLGYARGNNLGILSAWGRAADYLLIMNDDAYMPDTDTVSHLLAALEGDQGAAAITPLTYTENDSDAALSALQVVAPPSATQLLVTYSWWLRRLPGLSSLSRSQQYVGLQPYPSGRDIPLQGLNGACFMVRKDIMVGLQGFDPNTFMYFEEPILAHRLMDAGYHCMLCTHKLVVHEQGSSSSGATRESLLMRLYALQGQAYYARNYLKASKIYVFVLVVMRAIDAITRAPARRLGKCLRPRRC